MLRTRTRSLFGGHLNKAAQRHLNRPAKPGTCPEHRDINIRYAVSTFNLQPSTFCMAPFFRGLISHITNTTFHHEHVPDS